MSAVQNFRITFENIFRRSERKISGATLDLVGTILRNAGLDEGEWTLRDSHRIKKKGRERFHAIRVESRGGSKSVRIWCKPRGNDSCFEYSLVPPADIEPEDVFKILRRTNPVTLAVAESPSLPKAFLNHVIGMPPKLIIPEKTEVVEVEETMEVAEVEEKAEEGLKMSEEASENIGGVQPLSESNRPAGGLIEAQEEPLGFSLVVDEPCLLSEQEVMDKAILAISIVAIDGYAKKTEASESIIKNLCIREFVENVSGGTYTSVEGAMRALTMALSNRGHYIQKIHYPSGDGVRGYKLTAKAERRIKTLREKYNSIRISPEGICGSDVEGFPLLDHRIVCAINKVFPDGGARVGAWKNWHQSRLPTTQDIEPNEIRPEVARSEAAETDEPVEQKGITTFEASEEIGRFGSGDLDRLQALIKECKEAESHIREVDSVILNLDAEIADLQIDMEALDLAERERLRQIEELNRDIERIKAKREPIAKAIDQKIMDRESWEQDKAPMVTKKSEIEMEIFGVTGRRRAN